MLVKVGGQLRTALGLVVAVCCSGLAQPVAAQTSPSAFTSATRYDLMHRVVGTIAPDPDGSGPIHYAAVRNTYDSDGRLVSVEKGELAGWQDETIAPAAWSAFTVFQRVDTTYDLLDRKLSDAVSSGGTTYGLTQYSYDAVGRPQCTTVRMNPATFASPPASACTLGTQGSAGPDRITQQVYDDAGQVLKVQKAVGTALQQNYSTYAYTANGKQASVTDANGNLSAYTYDGFDRLVQWSFPSPTSTGSASSTDYEQYGYDANGNRTSLRKRDGRTIAYTYDALNRVTLKTPSGACVSGYACTTPPASAVRPVYYGYDTRGLQLYARFDNATGEGITNVYDGFGRLTSATSSMGGMPRILSYVYDADGNRTRLTHPDGVRFDETHDGLERTTATSWTVPGSAAVPFYAISYDAQGRRTTTTRASSSTSYGYDGVSRLASLTQTFASATSNATTTFGYNPASQIAQQTRSNTAFVYTGYANTNTAYTPNGLNQYTAVGTGTLGYDANGNLTSTGGTSLVYDVENRLVQASGTLNASLAYDPLGRLWQTSGADYGTSQFVYDGDEAVLEYNGDTGAIRRRFAFGPAGDEPVLWAEGAGLDCSATKFLHPDQQGSIVAVADCYGNLVQPNSYDEYGVPASGNFSTTFRQRFQYTGQMYLPELGMYYYKARIYSSRLGRFLQTDPIGYKDQNDLYTYVANDPVNKTDPAGTDIVDNDPKTRAQVQSMINAVSKTQYSFDKNGKLQADASLGVNKKGSGYYSTQLNRGIAGKQTISATVAQTMKYSVPGIGGAAGVMFKREVDVDKQGGGGLTRDNQVVVTGRANSDHGVPLSPAMILAHELASHAIPNLYGGGTGNAIKDENIIRQQLGLPLRPADPGHTECMCE